ncbi:MAG: putative CtpA-like serine protease [Firmicutes bacterium ADurb.Bin419]|nr:MAG: putative CtpA-like serine protease [Firmicutes bacterium ADurb.Bin419]
MYSQKNYSDCLDYCNSVKADLPDNYDIAYYKGDCYSILGEHDKAISAYEEAHKLVPEDTSLLSAIGWEYYSLEEYEKAKQYAQEALDLDSEDYMAKSLDEYANEAMKPEAERIVNFVRNNYLYLDKVTNFEQMAQKFIEKKDVDLPDIYEFLESVRLKDDLYTFFIFDEYYKQMLEEEQNNKIEHRALSDNIQYIKINSFTSGIDEQFRSIVKKIPDSNEQILVLDLRDNPGGLANTANNMLDTLLPECVTSYMIDRAGEIYSYSSDKNNTEFKHIYVYVNEGSASSSELLALGLKTYLNNVTIIGRPTVGKGVCQTVFENKKEKYMIFLVECYWNIKEKNVSDKKIQPDINIKGNELSDYIEAMNGHIDKIQ